jgi:hypothetical protein
MVHFLILKNRIGKVIFSQSSGTIIPASDGVSTQIEIIEHNSSKQKKDLVPIGIVNNRPVKLTTYEAVIAAKSDTKAWFDATAGVIITHLENIARLIKEDLEFLSFVPNNPQI